MGFCSSKFRRIGLGESWLKYERVSRGEGIDLQNFFFFRFLCSVFPALTFLLTSLEIEGVPPIKKRSEKKSILRNYLVFLQLGYLFDKMTLQAITCAGWACNSCLDLCLAIFPPFSSICPKEKVVNNGNVGWVTWAIAIVVYFSLLWQREEKLNRLSTNPDSRGPR